MRFHKIQNVCMSKITREYIYITREYIHPIPQKCMVPAFLCYRIKRSIEPSSSIHVLPVVKRIQVHH